MTPPATRDPLVRVSAIAGGLLLMVMAAATVPAVTPAAEPVTEPLVASSAYCAPGPGQSGVAAIATTGTTPGTVALGALAPGTEAPATESGAGFTPTASGDADRPLNAWVPQSQVTGVLGTEGGAAGLSVAQVSRSGAGDAVGLAELVCAAPATEFWFVGGGSDVGRRTVLELVNPDPTAAAVDIRLFTASGLAEPVAGQGVPVPGGGRTSVRMDQLAPGQAALALNVTARTGRVSAGLFDLAIRGAQPEGIDWVPPSVGPDTNLVVPGVFALPDGESELLLAAPGERTASVQVEVVAADGAFIPVGLEAVEVPAGGLAAVPLTELVGRADVGLVLTSDEPVIAGVRLRAGGAPPDFAYVAAAPALIGVAAAPANTSDVAARLSVVAPEGATTVSVTVVDADGRRTTSQLDVASRSAATLSVVPPAGAYSILVTTDAEPVHVARLSSVAVNDSVFVTAVPLTSRPDSVTLPAAPADPGAGIPGR
jgi:hypothetical protein